MSTLRNQLISKEARPDLLECFHAVRTQSLRICEPLETEDYVVQPMMDVSPPKWHLAHTTWFFENFILVPHLKDYQVFDKNYAYLFNSYYISAGDRWDRAGRGFLTRPTVGEILAYRTYVEQHIHTLLAEYDLSEELEHLLETGLQHEQQHQELLLYDIKYILGNNPLFPAYTNRENLTVQASPPTKWLHVEQGNYHIGHEGPEFCFDNELGQHEVHLHAYAIASHPVTNEEYLEFIIDGGYEDHRLWLSEGWEWLKAQHMKAPLYWMREAAQWKQYSLYGLHPVNPSEPVSHISYYEADAFARWKGCRLPTECEWETAARLYEPQIPLKANFVEMELFKPTATEQFAFFGNLWEWTSSAYQPYPFYQAPDGALGEYNGKFMINQMVLRGGSFATPRSHIRLTYRNFFHPNVQWVFNGIRLARHF